MNYLRVKIEENDWKLYFVHSSEGYRLVTTNPLYCSCPDFVSRVLLQKKKKTCKHINLILSDKRGDGGNEEIVLSSKELMLMINTPSFLEKGIIKLKKEKDNTEHHISFD